MAGLARTRSGVAGGGSRSNSAVLESPRWQISRRKTRSPSRTHARSRAVPTACWPGARLGGARAPRKIGLRFRILHPVQGATQSHLPVERFPMKKQRAFVVSIQFPALLAVDIGIEHEALLAEALHKHHADVGQAVLVDGGQRHGGGRAPLAPARLLATSDEQ